MLGQSCPWLAAPAEARDISRSQTTGKILYKKNDSLTQAWQVTRNLHVVYNEAILHKHWKKYLGNILIHPKYLRPPQWREDYPAVISRAGLKGGQTSRWEKVSKARVCSFAILRNMSASSSVEGGTWWRAPVCLSEETQMCMKTFLVEEGVGKKVFEIIWLRTDTSKQWQYLHASASELKSCLRKSTNDCSSSPKDKQLRSPSPVYYYLKVFHNTQPNSVVSWKVADFPQLTFWLPLDYISM